MEKDALCACKDDVALENVRFWQRRFLIRFRERSQLCFDFRVAYSDGLVSRLVEDRKNRTPVGIVVKGWLVLGKEAPRLMTWDEGLKYCANVKVNGKGCQLCPEDLRDDVVEYDGEINFELHIQRMFRQSFGTVFLGNHSGEHRTYCTVCIGNRIF